MSSEPSECEDQGARRRLQSAPDASILGVVRARAAGPALLIGLTLAAGACRSELGAPPPLFTAAGEAGAPAGASPPLAPPAVAEPHRELWFASGPGRDAILARERKDFDRAAQLLDQLLSEPGLSEDDRGAALLLRGLDEVRAGQHSAAAGRFAAARGAPSLVALEGRLRLLEGQALLDSGQAGAALEVLSQVPVEGALAAGVLLAVADARQRTSDRAGAREGYERFLADHGGSPRRHEAKVKLARLLAAGSDPTELRGALALFEGLALDVPLSDYGQEASAAIPALEARIGGQRSFVAEQQASRERALARLRELLARGRYDALLKEVDSFLRGAQLARADRCQALFIKASAVFKQRRRAEARPIYEGAAAECKKAGESDTEVRARYQAGRGRYAEGKYERAARDFQALARDFPSHSYADDAMVLAGESWAELAEREREREAYERALEIGGDMAAEARRRLIVRAFVDERFADAAGLTDQGLLDHGLELGERAKLHYYRGRALQRLGRGDEALTAWEEVIRIAPLSYPALQALSRLRDAGEGPLARGLALLEEPRGALTELSLPPVPAAGRARILASLGLGEEAQSELQDAGVGGWPAASVLAQAGLFAESQRLIGGLGGAWRQSPPVGERRRLWELAHPLAFEEIIRAGEPGHQVPPLLTFAIMQTESRFDPGATSWAGARGLVQLMPGTAKDLAQKSGISDYSPARLYEPAFNLDLGMRYLGRLVLRFGGDEAAAALAIPSYNAGAGAVDRWITKLGDRELDLLIESIPFDETRKYTQSVLERWWIYRWVYASPEATPAERVLYLPLELPAKGSAGGAAAG
ncbi:MAG: transglycosylase SLT domain-containing protein [Nannocystis sp.]|nr:transglycosylase SLT domain-containing protein [Nannocystis sp.]